MSTSSPDTPGFDRIARVSVKDLALAQLKRYIISGSTVLGQRLPSERDLAARLGVGRNSLREAIKVLEAVGLVESRIGEGTFIIAQTGATIGRTIGLKLATWGGTIVEILGARQIIEVEGARVAAERATEEDIQALSAELEQMEAAIDFQVYLKADMNFHRLLAQATHNVVVKHIIADLLDLLEEVLREASGDQLPTDIESLGSHREVYEAIQHKDGAAAAAAMRQHLQFSTELWQTIVSLSVAPSDTTP